MSEEFNEEQIASELTAETDTARVSKNVIQLDAGVEEPAYTRVIVHVGQADDGKEQIYEWPENGSDQNILDVYNPFGTLAMAKNIYNDLTNNPNRRLAFRYQPMDAVDAYVTPMAEVGDGFSAGSVYSGIYKQDINFSKLMANNVSAPYAEETEHEFSYISQEDRKFERATAYTRSKITQTNNEIALQVEEYGHTGRQNLIPFPYYFATNGAGTYTVGNSSTGQVRLEVQSDGTIKATVLQTLITDVFATVVSFNQKIQLETGTYHSNIGVAGVVQGVRSYTSNGTNTSLLSTSNPAGGKFNWTDPSRFLNLNLLWTAGTEANSTYTIKPQIELGTEFSKWHSPVNSRASQLLIHSDEINARVLREDRNGKSGFGWSLLDNEWKVGPYKNSSLSPVLTVNASGLVVNGSGTFSGKVEAKEGFIGSSATNGFTINSTSISNGTLNTNKDDLSSSDGTYVNGVFISKDKIRLGNGFVVTKAGVLTAKSGTIGGVTISGSALYTNGKTGIDTNVSGVHISSSGISLGTAGKFKVTNAGAITATSGTIGGFNITSTIFQKLTADTTTNGGIQYWFYVQAPATPTSSNYAIALRHHVYDSSTQKYGSWIDDFYVSYAGKLQALNATVQGKIQATSGFIGENTTNGFTITSSSIYNGKSALGNSSNGVYIGKDGIALGASSKFKVDNAGNLTATAATISGAVTATSGTIGGITINKDYGIYTNGKTSATSTATGFLIAKGGAIYLGAYNSTSGSCPFQVTSAGVLTARSGKVGGFSMTSSQLANGGTAPTLAQVKAATNQTLWRYGVELNSGTSSSNRAFGAWSRKYTLNAAQTAVVDNGAVYNVQFKNDGTGNIGGFNFDQGAFWKSTANVTTNNSKQYQLLLNAKSSTPSTSDIALTLRHHTYSTSTSPAGYGGWVNDFYVTYGGAVVASNLEIKGGKIQIGNKFTVDSSGAVTASDLTIRGGSINIGSRFSVDSSGNLSATNVNLNGKVTASSGKIANFTISGIALHSYPLDQYGNADWDNYAGVYLASNGICIGKRDSQQGHPFYVDQWGNMTVRNATVRGRLSAGDIAYGGNDGTFNGAGITSGSIGTAYGTALSSGAVSGINWGSNFGAMTTQSYTADWVCANHIVCYYGGSISGQHYGSWTDDSQSHPCSWRSKSLADGVYVSLSASNGYYFEDTSGHTRYVTYGYSASSSLNFGGSINYLGY